MTTCPRPRSRLFAFSTAINSLNVLLLARNKPISNHNLVTAATHCHTFSVSCHQLTERQTLWGLKLTFRTNVSPFYCQWSYQALSWCRANPPICTQTHSTTSCPSSQKSVPVFSDTGSSSCIDCFATCLVMSSPVRNLLVVRLEILRQIARGK